jgi:hypothetical protein
VADDASQPEHVDLAALVRANADMRAARAQLAAKPDSNQAIERAREAISRHVGALEDPGLWATLVRLTEQQRELERMNRDAWALLQQLLPQAAPGSPDRRRDIEQPPKAVAWVQTAEQRVWEFNTLAREVTKEPIPPARETARRAGYVAVLMVVLDKAIDLVMNLAVAGAFAVDAVNAAAAKAATNVADDVTRAAKATAGAAGTVVEVAGRGLELAEPALPWLLAVAVVGAQATAAVIAIRNRRSASQSYDAGVAPVDGYPPMATAGEQSPANLPPASADTPHPRRGSDTEEGTQQDDGFLLKPPGADGRGRPRARPGRQEPVRPVTPEAHEPVPGPYFSRKGNQTPGSTGTRSSGSSPPPGSGGTGRGKRRG